MNYLYEEELNTKCKKCRFLNKIRTDENCLYLCRRDTEPHDGCDDKLISGDYILEDRYDPLIVTAKETKSRLTLTVKDPGFEKLYTRYTSSWLPLVIQLKTRYVDPGTKIIYGLNDFRPITGNEIADCFGLFQQQGKEIFFHRCNISKGYKMSTGSLTVF